MKKYRTNIGNKITIKNGVEYWDIYDREYKWKPLTGILTAFRTWTEDGGAVTWWATINGTEYNVTNKSFTILN